jgi:hypothetical protein
MTSDTMDIFTAKPGTKIRYTGENGRASDREDANKVLQVNAIYTVDSLDVDSWHTDVYLKEVPNHPFNSVLFEDVHDGNHGG